MTINHSNFKCGNGKKKHWSKQTNNIEFNTLRNHTTLYHTYHLLYYIGHI